MRHCLSLDCIRVILGASILGIATQGAVFGQASEKQRYRASLVYALTDMTYSGASIAAEEDVIVGRYNYNGPVAGAEFSLLGSRIGIAVGLQDSDDLWLVDGWLITESLTSVADFSLGTLEVTLPVGAAATYRRVGVRGAEGVGFSSTTVGLGVGLNVEGAIRHESRWALSGKPFFGISSSPHTDAMGWAGIMEADLKLTFPYVWGSIGFGGGYTVRYQVWNNRGTRIFGEFPDELYDYTSFQHGLVVGISF